jgi:hypothetical protein
MSLLYYIIAIVVHNWSVSWEGICWSQTLLKDTGVIHNEIIIILPIKNLSLSCKSYNLYDMHLITISLLTAVVLDWAIHINTECVTTHTQSLSGSLAHTHTHTYMGATESATPRKLILTTTITFCLHMYPCCSHSAFTVIHVVVANKSPPNFSLHLSH